MNNKGFTLTEIIAVIVILGLLFAIGTPVYFTISNNTKQKELNNKLEYLKSQAIKYAEDNTIDASKTIAAGTLVYDGYVVADKYVKEQGEEIPFIINPADDEDNLACRVINISVKDYDYIAKVTDDSNCDLINEDTFANEIGVKVYKYYNNTLSELIDIKEDNKNWVNTDVAVVVNPTYDNILSTRITHQGKTIEVNNNNVLTEPSVGLRINQTYSNVVIVTASTVLKDEIHVAVQTKDSIKNAVIKINIDKEEPRIKSSAYDGWTKKDGKNAKAYVSDGNGSGAKYVYLTAENNIGMTNIYNRFEVTDEVATINHGYDLYEGANTPLSNGTYYLWAEDEVGNMTSYSTELVISNSDAIAPTCEIRNDNSVWKTETRKIIYGCVDNESGCSVDNSGYFKDVNYSTKKQLMEQTTLVDNTGNETVCPERIVDAYVDIDNPYIESITVESQDSRFNTANTNVVVKAKDDHSGLKSVCILIDDKKIEHCKWVDVDATNIDTIHNEGPTSYTFKVSTTIGTYNRKTPASYQVYAYVKDMLGHVSEVKSKSYATYKYCDAKNRTGESEYGDCSESCGGGTQSRTVYYSDKFFPDQTCPNGSESSSCNTHDCPSSGGGDCCTSASETDGHGSGPGHWGCTCKDGSWHGGCSGPGTSDC